MTVSQRSRDAFLADQTDPRHGTANGYGNFKCRCDRCREANTEAQRAYMAAHPEQLQQKLKRAREKYAPHPLPPTPCGTAGARARHRLNGERCEICRVGLRDPIRCGTRNGWQRHKRRGEEPCEDCQNAISERQQRRRVARRDAANEIERLRAELLAARDRLTAAEAVCEALRTERLRSHEVHSPAGLRMRLHEDVTLALARWREATTP